MPPPTSFDPTQVPVTAIDADLPPVSADRLDAEALRARFLSPPTWTPEIVGEMRRTDRSPVHASVLIAVVQRPEPTLLLTQRTDHLKDHAGQISFPGGRAESYDADAVATALREADEEIGLPPDEVDVLGALPTYTTGTGFIVTPVVGLVQPRFTLKIDPQEVAEAFEVPFSYLMTPANHRRHAVDLPGMRREFISMPWPGATATGDPRQYFIWGATASMLRNLYRFLSA
jgi:8-oxo-dGTP pyrophosphatase MutT (NUDIX family)